MKSPACLWLALLISGSTSCGGGARLPDAGPAGTAEVETLVVRSTSAAVPVRLAGTVQAVRAADLGPPTMARVAAVLVTEGRHVEANQVLVQLDSGSARLRAAQGSAGVAVVEAQARHADEEYARLAPLARQGTIPGQRLEQIDAERQALRAQIAAAEAGAAAARGDPRAGVVAAPFAGIVSTIYVHVGEIAIPGRPAIRLVDPSQLELRARASDRAVVTLRAGDPFVARFPSLDREVAGVIDTLPPEVDPITRTAEIVASIPNLDGLVLPGTFAVVEIRPAHGRDRLLVPLASVGGTSDARFVFVVSHGRAARRRVRTSPFDAERIEVTSGLREGERIVAGDLLRVTDGTRIRPTRSSGAGGPAREPLAGDRVR